MYAAATQRDPLMTRARIWTQAHALVWPGLSTLGAAAALGYALYVSQAGGTPAETLQRVPERAAVEEIATFLD